MQIIHDCEIYKNYALFSFFVIKTGQIIELEMYEGQPLDKKRLRNIVGNHTIITFNGDNYDMPMVAAALGGADNRRLKLISDSIIKKNLRGWQTTKQFNLPRLTVDHIDIREPTAGVQISLKMYGARIGTKILQELPIDPDSLITPEQRPVMRKYCRNDLQVTYELFQLVEGAIKLRADMSREYGVDLRSKSDAQMAEAIFRHYLNEKGVDVHKVELPANYSFSYKLPNFIQFKSPALQRVAVIACTTEFKLSDKGAVVIPKELGQVIKFADGKYKIGIGGLHSQEKKQAIVPTPDQMFGEWDVASMYPNIILGQKLYPLHLGPKFVDVYRTIVHRRLTAKRTGDKVTNEVLKIALNGTFGKFGSKYSYLYSPDLLIQTTVTGQLALLMLIERLTAIGAKVVSANTDGVNVLHDKSLWDEVEATCIQWDLDCAYDLEYTPYSATYNRDVNNYVAITSYGAKAKGVYAPTGLMKNPTNLIVSDAVIAYLKDGVPVEETICFCEDITKFITARRVTGGAEKDGVPIGKVIRWYYAEGVTGTINYIKNGNKVPKSEGAKPCMDLPDKFPSDLDYDWYIKAALDELNNMGATHA